MCQVAVTGDVARTLMVTLHGQLEGRLKFIGPGAGGVEIVLATDETALAAELSARYGDAVAVTVCPDSNSCIATPA